VHRCQRSITDREEAGESDRPTALRDVDAHPGVQTLLHLAEPLGDDLQHCDGDAEVVGDFTYEELFASLLGSHKGSMVEVRVSGFRT